MTSHAHGALRSILEYVLLLLKVIMALLKIIQKLVTCFFFCLITCFFYFQLSESVN